MSLFNETTFIIFSGVSLLLFNILYGLLRAARGQVKAGWFTVGLALAACVLILIGSVQVTVASASQTSPQASVSTRSGAGNYGARLTATAQAGSATSVPATQESKPAQPDTFKSASDAPLASSTPSAPPTNTPRTENSQPANKSGIEAALVQGTQEPTSASASSAATDPATPAATRRSRGTPGAGTPNAPEAGNSNANRNPNGGSTTSGGNPPTAPTSAFSSSASSDPIGLKIALIGGAIGFVLAFVLYQVERRRAGFSAVGSRGLLNLGAASFVIFAAFAIPLLPAQMGGGASAAAAAPAAATRSIPVAIRALSTATPTAAPRASLTPTPLPSLTPMPTDTPFVMPTEIQYAARTNSPSTSPATGAATTDAITASSAAQCTLSVTHNLNLRSTPSTSGTLLLTLPAGTNVTATGKTADKQWWQVTYNGGAKTDSGWVSAQYATPTGNCKSVPVVKSP